MCMLSYMSRFLWSVDPQRYIPLLKINMAQDHLATIRSFSIV